METFEPYDSVSGKKPPFRDIRAKRFCRWHCGFIRDMAVCGELKDMPLSGIGGIENFRDALQFILLGCGNVQVTTAVMQYGYRIIDDLTSGLKAYMARKKIKHLKDLVGLGLKKRDKSRKSRPQKAFRTRRLKVKKMYRLSALLLYPAVTADIRR
ncbi:MAG: hypothetical protein L6V93_02520 [Clostridiales bacterium]|nr:MAG: hypothetical protein L6V93_02520 [Clostridiales bacterium]